MYSCNLTFESIFIDRIRKKHLYYVDRNRLLSLTNSKLKKKILVYSNVVNLSLTLLSFTKFQFLPCLTFLPWPSSVLDYVYEYKREIKKITVSDAHFL